IKALKEGGALIMFPEGTRSRTGEMLPFRRGIGFIVDKTDAAVLPAYITGSDKIKKRILKPGGITIKFGEIVYNLNSIYSGSDKFERIARHVRDEVEKLI
nr:1-acyl-sn-glycerol-3-phosphate acyltransferase [FCB group bacterium]